HAHPCSGPDMLYTPSSKPPATPGIYTRSLHDAIPISEVNDTEYGVQHLKQFVYDVCECQGNWTIENYIKSEVDNIKQTVGNKKVLCALSGGVDSSVVAALIHKAIGDQLTCIFVDHGLLRKNEANDVMDVFAKDFHMNIIKVDAADRFLTKLKGVSNPEQKRKIIGNEF